MLDEPDYLKVADAARRSIPATVRTLMYFHRVKLPALALALGVSKASASARLNGHTRFSADEIAAMAKLFDVEPGVFYRDLSDLEPAAGGDLQSRGARAPSRCTELPSAQPTAGVASAPRAGYRLAPTG